MYDDEKECVYHKWCGIKQENESLYVVNRGMYGGSFTNSTIKLSLLRTPIYAAHPIQERQIAPHDRWLNHIDMGERQFSFRITTEKNIDREAQVYNETPQLLSFFPSGEGECKQQMITVDNSNIILSSLKKKETGYELILFNTSDCEQTATLVWHRKKEERELHFGKYEILKLKLS